MVFLTSLNFSVFLLFSLYFPVLQLQLHFSVAVTTRVFTFISIIDCLGMGEISCQRFIVHSLRIYLVFPLYVVSSSILIFLC